MPEYNDNKALLDGKLFWAALVCCRSANDWCHCRSNCGEVQIWTAVNQWFQLPIFSWTAGIGVMALYINEVKIVHKAIQFVHPIRDPLIELFAPICLIPFFDMCFNVSTHCQILVWWIMPCSVVVWPCQLTNHELRRCWFACVGIKRNCYCWVKCMYFCNYTQIMQEQLQNFATIFCN